MTVQDLIDTLTDLDPETEVLVGVVEHYEGELQTEPLDDIFFVGPVLVMCGFAWAKLRRANPDSPVEHTNPY